MLASFIRKVFSPCDYRRQAMMTNKGSSSSSPMHLGNKYLPHASLSSFQPCVGCFLAWKLLIICNCCGFGLFISFGIYLWYLWWNGKNYSFNWYSFFVILVSYLKASPLSLIPLVICVMSLMCLNFIYIQWDKFELCAMLLRNNLFRIFMTSFLDTLCSPSWTILYVHVSLWIYIFNDLST